MPYETVAQAREALRELQGKQRAYQHAMGVISLDASTVAPKDSTEGRGRTMAVLSQASFDLLTAPENRELFDFLAAHKEELDERARRELELTRRECDVLTRIPAEEYVAYAVLLNEAGDVWEKAKNASDFSLFLPYLEKIVETNRRFAGYYDPKKAPYDALLNEFERGLDTATLDGFFAHLREELVPLIRKVSAAKQPDDSFLRTKWPVAKQRQLSDYLMEVMGIDRSHCGIAESEHPFTTDFNHKDVRITTHYYEDDFLSSMYSVIHESGHALYELNCGPEFEYTFVSGGVSMGIHESQSRFYENIVGRSRPFLHAIFPKLQELFPEQLAGVTEEMLWRVANKAQPSLIRTEADELTYCMHVMIRYELEKQLIAGTLAPADVPEAWNRLYKEYLGVDVPNDKVGCLQDSHWSGGAIGYFPSYALGSAYGAQMLSVLERDVPDVWDRVGRGDLSGVTDWLREHIHKYASLYEPGALFEKVCGKFDPDCFVAYLTKKYTELYDL